MNQAKLKPTILDRLITYFSPQQGLKRVNAQQHLVRKYEGATKTRRTAGWSTNNASSAAETYRSLDTLRNRSRDLIQNNPHAKRACDAVVTNAIGTGIFAQIKDTKSAARSEKIKKLFKDWMLTTDCDFEGTKTFFMMQDLVTRSCFENGECLVLRKYPKNSEYTYAPLKLQLLEPDHLDTSGFFSKPAEGNKLIQGIEYTTAGMRIAYHLFIDHPGGINVKQKTVRVPASEVLHVYDELRVGQVRGVPHLAPAIIKLRDYDEYEDAQLQRQKIAACFAGYIRDLEVPEEYTESELEVAERIEPGTLEVLPPGKDITFPNTPSVEGIESFAKISLRSIAAAMGISYESMTMDYSNVNFSSGRMGWIEMARTIQRFRNMVLIPKFLDQVFIWFLESAELIGYQTENIDWTWTQPKREMIDPGKEYAAMSEAVSSGLMTMSAALQSMGIDPEDHFEQMSKDLQLLDKYGLKLASDPRKDLSTKQS